MQLPNKFLEYPIYILILYMYWSIKINSHRLFSKWWTPSTLEDHQFKITIPLALISTCMNPYIVNQLFFQFDITHTDGRVGQGFSLDTDLIPEFGHQGLVLLQLIPHVWQNFLFVLTTNKTVIIKNTATTNSICVTTNDLRDIILCLRMLMFVKRNHFIHGGHFSCFVNISNIC